MSRILLALFSVLLGLVLWAVPAHAAGTPTSPPSPITWQQRDTAVYVVSTLNLVRTPAGQPLVEKLNAARFDVYADLARADLYFIILRSRDGSVVGAFAYQLGWAKPRSISRSTRLLGIERAPRSVVLAFRTDHKQLIGSFTSTMPGQ